MATNHIVISNISSHLHPILRHPHQTPNNTFYSYSYVSILNEYSTTGILYWLRDLGKRYNRGKGKR